MIGIMRRLDPDSDLHGDVIDALDIGIIVLDARHYVRTWNDWMIRHAGMSASRVEGRLFWDVFPALRDSRLLTAVEDALGTGAPSVVSHALNRDLMPLRRPDGRPLLHKVMVRRLGGEEPYCLLQISDVTAMVEREQVLRERRDARYGAVVEAAPDAIVTTDALGLIQWINGAAERQFGWTAAELAGRDISVLLGTDAGAWPRGPIPDTATLRRPTLDLAGRRRDGSSIDIGLSLAHWSADGRTFITGVLRDITDRRRAQERLEQSEARYRAAFEQVAVGFCEVDRHGRFLRVNGRFCEITGYTAEELKEQTFADISHPEDVEPNRVLAHRLWAGEIQSYSMEKRYIRKDGCMVWVNITCSAILGADGKTSHAVSVIEDISARKRAENEREQLLLQQELLTREAHHRVKNSLAIVAGLLSIQSRKIAEPSARAHLGDAYRRVLAISQVHEQLYQGSQVDRVDFGSFLRTLCIDLENSVVALERGQQIRTRVDATFALPTDKAIPIALILNELVTNSFKYAHPSGSPGTILVTCSLDAPGRLRLSVADDGVGLPPGFSPAGNHGLGMRVVLAMVTQLNATLEVRNANPGAEFVLTCDI